MKPFKLNFYIMPVRRPVDGFDWKVSLGIRTAKYIKSIIAQRIADGTNGYSLGDDTPTYFKTRAECEDHVRELTNLYGPPPEPWTTNE